ncbi:MAG: catalase [Coriobacteriia bacterium]|nr:catalase [Coriobacteriia bacterium]
MTDKNKMNGKDDKGLYKERSAVNDYVKSQVYTRENGAPVANDKDVMTVGARGPLPLQDVFLLEKFAHFDRETIPERRMHAKGWGAHGKFVTTEDITDLTYAAPFREIGKETEMFVRFSTVGGELGAADAERDIRGFALKFYTEDGNWDLVGNNTPVFFLRDPLRFTDLNRAVKRDPHSNLHSANSQWDFWTTNPESLMQVTITMSDYGIPKGFRHMHGYGSHTYSMINKDGVRHWVKFHFLSQQGFDYLTDEEAAELNATDRESFGRDMFGAIERGDYPRWTAYVQVMTEEEAEKHETNPFDLTKLWSVKDYPLRKVGYFELNRNPGNYFAEVEQVAMNPANIIPGIGFSPDRMLQARLFSYGDAQRYRLGVNHNLIPVNYPKHAKNFHSNHKDGFMRVDDNGGGEIVYSANSYGAWVDNPEVEEPPLKVEGDLGYYNFREDDNDYYSQPGEFFRNMSDDQKERLFMNTARDIKPAEDLIKRRHIAHAYFADPEYGKGLARAMEIDDMDFDELDQMIKDGKKGAYMDAHQREVDDAKPGQKVPSNDPSMLRNTEGFKEEPSIVGEGEAVDVKPDEQDPLNII